MQISLTSQPIESIVCDWLIVPIAENGEPQGLGASLTGRVTRLREAGDVTGKHAELVEIRDVADSPARRVLFVGLGDVAKLTSACYEQALMSAVRKISSKKVENLAVVLPSLAIPDGAVPVSLIDSARISGVAVTTGCVGQGLYKSEPDRFEFGAVTVAVAGGDADSGAVRAAIDEGQVLGESINLVRELVNRQPDDVYPESFADRASQLAAEHGLGWDVLDERRLNDERMRSMLAVARGSSRPPRMVVLEYRGAKADAPVLALVGKGVTFDSGGLSLKPTDGMKTMKCDMAGAATVLGAIVAAARLKLTVNITAYMGLVENMVSGASYKLGDILTARNGVTIEVQNTDAEGRLVLADVLSYAVDHKVAKIIDLATLTGACVVALGEDVAGGFTNNQSWYDAIAQAASRTGEDLWQLPMFDSYAEQLKCDVADVKNVGTRWGGAITAAKFLEKFVGATPWVHLDIAGPAFAESNKSHREGGATGAFVRTLVETARKFESSQEAGASPLA